MSIITIYPCILCIFVSNKEPRIFNARLFILDRLVEIFKGRDGPTRPGRAERSRPVRRQSDW